MATHTLHPSLDNVALDTSVINSIVRRVSFFKSLQQQDPAQALLLLSRSQLQNFSAGEQILQKGQSGPTIYFILSGSVEIYADSAANAKLLGTVAAGETFGEMALFANATRMATVKASPYNQRGTKVLACDFSGFGAMDDFSSLNLQTKLLFMRQLVQRAEWRLVKNRIRFPEHIFFESLNLCEPRAVEAGGIDELQELYRQAQELNKALMEWNAFGVEYRFEMGGLARDIA